MICSESELSKKYFDWMLKLIENDFHRVMDYEKLLRFLNSIDFIYVISMDGNREEDGRDLRYTFGYENNINSKYIKKHLDTRPCSVLEMLVALSFRIEKDIMEDYQLGSRINEWFWLFLENLDLDEFDNDNFNSDEVIYILNIWMLRKYKKNGIGNIIKLDQSYDLRTIDIWYQANLYFSKK